MRDARPPPGEGTPRPGTSARMERRAAAAGCKLLLALAACLVRVSGQGKYPLDRAMPELWTSLGTAGSSSVEGSGQGRAAARELLSLGRLGCPASGERSCPTAGSGTQQPPT